MFCLVSVSSIRRLCCAANTHDCITRVSTCVGVCVCRCVRVVNLSPQEKCLDFSAATALAKLYVTLSLSLKLQFLKDFTQTLMSMMSNDYLPTSGHA